MTNHPYLAVHLPALALAALVGVAGCQTTASRDDQGFGNASARHAGPAAIPPREQLSSSQYTARAIERLQVGDAESARGDLEWALRLKPDNATARTLLEQLDADPVAELGTRFFEYEVRAGDSLSMLARKYLGDFRKFYILARYNDLDDPSKLHVGQVVKVPGAAPHDERNATATRPARPAVAASATVAKATPATTEVPERAAPAGDYRQAKTLCANGDYEQAIASLRANPSDKRSRLLLASCYGAYAEEKVSAGELVQARELLASAVALDPSDRALATRLATVEDHLQARTLYDRGVAELRSGRLESSLDALNQALLVQPDYPSAVKKRNLVRKRLIDGYLEKAEDALSQRKLEEAIAAWDQVLDLDPGNSTAASRKKAALRSKAKL